MGALIDSVLNENGGFYNPYKIPPRLHDNIECVFAKIYSWPSSPKVLRQWIHDAFQRRDTHLPKNNQRRFSKNRSKNLTYWSE